MNDFEEQVALVTGANKGIGKELVRMLLERGLTVYLGSRDRGRGEAAIRDLAADGNDLRLLIVDVGDASSLTEAARTLEREAGRLDVLVNNAGILGGTEPPSRTRIEDLRAAYETNFFGPFLLTQALLPLLRKSGAPTIVNVSSDLGSLALIGYPENLYAQAQIFPYQSSKVAQNSLTVLLAKELRGDGFRVNAVNPGYTPTDMNGFQGTNTVESAAKTILKYTLMGEDGPTGGHFTENGTIPW